ncbi:hypothetical protein [Hymenobacter terrenus]|uniref:hypothetical protein n=1 Tax=Hymenobacter terrenus TaxID=1629124 RepID=UPI00061914E9|nr:hypothetical protein [Hymenobacter terrenus]
MMFGILFALLALFLAGFREGVWTKYTAQDVARWQAQAAAQSAIPPIMGQPALHHPAEDAPAEPSYSQAELLPETSQQEVVAMEMEPA